MACSLPPSAAAREARGWTVRCDREPGHACGRGGVCVEATRGPQGEGPEIASQHGAVLRASGFIDEVARLLRVRAHHIEYFETALATC